ncbi:TRAP transporter large permease [Aquibium oceanicum]|uniref:TRAP transporter large permease protein n=1 Tax=Aquibium oceanicum TaxID=1670800 RepID=A0A1L3SPV6_9HYPH|nr:TRAP transporter large permease [Aquibium oceanicum]APH71322.1 C4-dicarboxylate ABC transporter permease [Aquibium oceanicum]
MEPITLSWIGIVVLVALIMLRMPVAVALGLVGFVGYGLIEGFRRASLTAAAAPIELAQAYTFSVVPLFTLMGAVAASAGLSTDLFRASNAVLRGMRGSLSIASIFASALFGAVCGSSVATALTMSKVSIPQMLAAGYRPSLAAGSVAAGGTLGILIPPSLILMIYAIIAQQSVAELFMAALVPGLVLTALYCAVTLLLVRRTAGDPSIETQAAAAPREPVLPALARIWHVVLLFVVTLGGIYTGWFTPTEAAAVGALGAILLGLMLGRMGLRDLVQSFGETVRLVSSIIFIVMASTLFSYFIVQTGVAEAISSAMQSAGIGATGVIILLCAVYILMGCFLEGVAMILITVPITLPLILSFGFDPVWFGVMLVILIEIGLITPPMGMNLFVIRAVSPGITIAQMYRGAFPFLAAPLVLIALLILWPELALWLPSQLH